MTVAQLRRAHGVARASATAPWEVIASGDDPPCNQSDEVPDGHTAESSALFAMLCKRLAVIARSGSAL